MAEPLLINQYLLTDAAQFTAWKCPERPQCTTGSHTGRPGAATPLLAEVERWHQTQHTASRESLTEGSTTDAALTPAATALGLEET